MSTSESAKKQANRRARWTEALRPYGFKTIDQLIKAMLDGEVVIVRTDDVFYKRMLQIGYKLPKYDRPEHNQPE